MSQCPRTTRDSHCPQQQLRGSPALCSAATSSWDPRQTKNATTPIQGTSPLQPAGGVGMLCEKGPVMQRSVGTRYTSPRRTPGAWARLPMSLGVSEERAQPVSEDRQACDLKESVLVDEHREVGIDHPRWGRGAEKPDPEKWSALGRGRSGVSVPWVAQAHCGCPRRLDVTTGPTPAKTLPQPRPQRPSPTAVPAARVRPPDA